MTNASFETELQATFLTEAGEMLEDTEAAFVAIEASPNDASKIDKIFRLVHTIKGSAHVAGFSELGQFAHLFETLLGALRDQKLAVTPAIVDVLLEGNDRLKDFVCALRADHSAKIDASATESRIKSVLPAAGRKTVADHHPAASQASPPAAAANQASAARTAPSAPAPAPVLLVIDDETYVLQLLEATLQDGGFRVITSSSAKAALEIFRSQPIDVIFTDLKMPEMDGIEFAKAVRKVNEFVPIAFVSGHSSRQHLKDYLEIGVDSFIEKPFESHEVLAVAKRLMRTGQLRSALLTLSKLSFQAYVTVEKILSTLPLDESHAADKEAVDRCMQEVHAATTKILASERQLKNKR